MLAAERASRTSSSGSHAADHEPGPSAAETSPQADVEQIDDCSDATAAIDHVTGGEIPPDTDVSGQEAFPAEAMASGVEHESAAVPATSDIVDATPSACLDAGSEPDLDRPTETQEPASITPSPSESTLPVEPVAAESDKVVDPPSVTPALVGIPPTPVKMPASSPRQPRIVVAARLREAVEPADANRTRAGSAEAGPALGSLPGVTLVEAQATPATESRIEGAASPQVLASTPADGTTGVELTEPPASANEQLALVGSRETASAPVAEASAVEQLQTVDSEPAPQPSGTALRVLPAFNDADGEQGSLKRLPQIGDGMRARLAALGVSTLADLAAASPQELRNGLGPLSRLANVDAWIALAKRELTTIEG